MHKRSPQKITLKMNPIDMFKLTNFAEKFEGNPTRNEYNIHNVNVTNIISPFFDKKKLVPQKD